MQPGGPWRPAGRRTGPAEEPIASTLGMSSPKIPYNVVLVILDDLRADHVSANGYHRKTTPNLDALALNRTQFLNCFSPTGWTLTACASILTGQLGDVHGLVDHNRRFQRSKLGHFLGDGYQRVAFSNNGNVIPDTISVEYLESLGLKRKPAKWKFFGWDDGFDEYHWTHREDHLRPFRLAEEFLDRRAQSEDRGEEVKPYFLLFHSNIVHDYHMDRDYYLAAEKWLGRPVHHDLRKFPDGPAIWRNPPSGLSRERMLEEIEAKYDAGIEFSDRMLKGVLDRIDFSNTIVFVVSDHGEGFEPEVGRVHHCGRLHQDLLHVPLFLWLPAPLRERYALPKVEHKHCSTLDIVPTVLTLLGQTPDGFPGRALFDLSTHRRLDGIDRGYIYWREDFLRESYDTCRIEIRSTLNYPLKWIRSSHNDAVKEFAFNLAYDPKERVNLLDQRGRPVQEPEPITFVVCVNDQRELEENLLASPVALSRRHQWILVDNRDNRAGHGISRIYAEAAAKAENDLVFFLHQDLYLPPGWEERLSISLRSLERRDPAWGVIGAVGAIAARKQEPSQPKELLGHWCDPHGYHRTGPLPAEVESLDEQWLGVRRSRGPAFDPDLPGFHCYGIDLSLTAREMGLKSYALDVFVWHKYRDSQGNLIESRDKSPKILERWKDGFMAGFNPSAHFVEKKWNKFLPFQTTSWTWR